MKNREKYVVSRSFQRGNLTGLGGEVDLSLTRHRAGPPFRP